MTRNPSRTRAPARGPEAVAVALLLMFVIGAAPVVRSLAHAGREPVLERHCDAARRAAVVAARHTAVERVPTGAPRRAATADRPARCVANRSLSPPRAPPPAA